MPKYVVLEKKVGQTPLQCAEMWRGQQTDTHRSVPLSYAGRLDPMASGKLLVLIGEECKNQEQYHGLDKEYVFEVLFGVASDTGDVLGRLTTCDVQNISKETLSKITQSLVGDVALPYPHYSSKTVQGKPLHTWALEGRLNEITIPTKVSTIHHLECTFLRNVPRDKVHTYASKKIETIPKVTEVSKALGNDFRRVDVRKDWKKFLEVGSPDDTFYIAKFTCVASSGTYMRTLAEVIAKKLDTCGLAYSIHRTKIGVYQPLPFNLGFWKKLF